MLKLIKVNFRKTITDKSFYACIIMTFVLCFTAVISNNLKTGDPENILTVMRNYDSQMLLNNENLNTFYVFATGGGSWFAMFLPIIAAFSFVGAFSDERESKFLRYSISRTGKLRYNTGNFLSAFLSGGIAVTIGYILFGIVISFAFYPLSEYPKSAIEYFNISAQSTYGDTIFNLYTSHGMGVLYAVNIVEMFLFGAMSVLPAFLLSAVIRNKYLILCIPFFLKYVLTQLSIRMMSKAYGDWENPDEKLGKIASVINPDAVNNVLSNRTFLRDVTILNAALIIAAFVMFQLLMNRRLDSGE